jgi:hypothetical protein
MHLDRAAGDRLCPVADDDVFDGELGGRRPGREVDLGLSVTMITLAGTLMMWQRTTIP